MIKFFRKIRQNLLMENKTSKYFKYAIGEIVLVVIGIIIALQINNWNEERKLGLYENQLLQQLKVDLERNSKDLIFNIRLQKNIINSSEIVLHHLEKKLPNNDSLKKHFANTVLWTKLVVNKGAYKTIESKGLDLISDLALRDLVFRIYEGNLNWLQQMENMVINQTELFRTSKASDFFKVLDPITIKNKRFGEGNAVVIDYNLLLNNKGNNYTFYVHSLKNETQILKHISEGYLDDNQQAITKIDSILKITTND